MSAEEFDAVEFRNNAWTMSQSINLEVIDRSQRARLNCSNSSNPEAASTIAKAGSMVTAHEGRVLSIDPEPFNMDDVRELVTANVSDLGFDDPKLLGEQIICCERFYFGIQIVFEGISAIWLSEAGHVRFVDASGKLLRIVRFAERKEVAKKTA